MMGPYVQILRSALPPDPLASMAISSLCSARLTPMQNPAVPARLTSIACVLRFRCSLCIVKGVLAVNGPGVVQEEVVQNLIKFGEAPTDAKFLSKEADARHRAHITGHDTPQAEKSIVLSTVTADKFHVPPYHLSEPSGRLRLRSLSRCEAAMVTEDSGVCQGSAGIHDTVHACLLQTPHAVSRGEEIA